MPVSLKNIWWKIAGIILISYVILGGLLFDVPLLPVLHESIRNVYFHVGMWFGMMFILFVALIFSIRYLLYNDARDDMKAVSAVQVGLLFGVLGLITGMMWANATWGSFWVNDPKLNGAVVGVLTYLAYSVLRSSVDDREKRARLAAVYNIFAFVLFFIFIMIIPRLATASIHPGIDGNPALATGDMAPEMRKVFFPAMAGWFIMAWWIFTIVYRSVSLEIKIQELTENQ
ncbi:MAG: cytochrome c biogenesis protein CcsA [Bacteroidales bacterium]|nr:cytochrome c biogenesis protein CcsA [Bacteroidales bacterium]